MLGQAQGAIRFCTLQNRLDEQRHVQRAVIEGQRLLHIGYGSRRRHHRRETGRCAAVSGYEADDAPDHRLRIFGEQLNQVDHHTVRRIEVTEQGGPGRTWKNTWYRTYDSYVELPCDDAEFGRYYRVTVTWYNWRSRDEVTSSWEPRVWRDSQKESYSRP